MNRALLFSTLATAVLAIEAQATTAMSIGGEKFQTATIGTSVPEGTLFQLINLGADGVFNPINVGDGTTAGNARWVSGDDQVITGNFGNNDFSSAAGFDLKQGAGIAGTFDRVFVFQIADLASGTKIGLRWFPGLLATEQPTITLAAGQSYGQFTRQANAVYGLDLWIVPSDGSTITVDPMVTLGAGGSDANSLGVASFVVVVPEPSSVGLLGVGLLGLLRRRRAQR